MPPPPSSGKDRTNRSSESGSLFSPKTPHTLSNADQISDTSLLASPKEANFCNEFNTSYDETSNSTEWFSPPSTTKVFDQPSVMVAEQPKDEHEKKKQEILSQFDVFTELDPLGIHLLCFIISAIILFPKVHLYLIRFSNVHVNIKLYILKSFQIKLIQLYSKLLNFCISKIALFFM